MINLSVPINWNKSYLQSCIELNKTYEGITISELYGEPSPKLEQEYLDLAKEHNIKITCRCTEKDGTCTDNILIDSFKDLYMLSENLIDLSKPNYVLSELMCINSAQVISKLPEQVSKITLDTNLNKNSYSLDLLSDKYAGKLELIVNDFCIITCPHKSDCPAIRQDFTLNSYPLADCLKERYDNPVEWVKSPFILPQYLEYYVEEYSITNFKILSKSLYPEKYTLWLIEQYMIQTYNDNLLNLWTCIDKNNKLVDGTVAPTYELDIKSTLLEGYKFIDSIHAEPIDCFVECALEINSSDLCSVCYDTYETFYANKPKKH